MCTQALAPGPAPQAPVPSDPPSATEFIATSIKFPLRPTGPPTPSSSKSARPFPTKDVDLSVSLKMGAFDTNAKLLRTCSLPDLKSVDNTAAVDTEESEDDSSAAEDSSSDKESDNLLSEGKEEEEEEEEEGMEEGNKEEVVSEVPGAVGTRGSGGEGTGEGQSEEMAEVEREELERKKQEEEEEEEEEEEWSSEDEDLQQLVQTLQHFVEDASKSW